MAPRGIHPIGLALPTVVTWTALGRRHCIFSVIASIRKISTIAVEAASPSSSSSTSASTTQTPPSVQPPRVLPHLDPRFQYGDVLILDDQKGDRRLVGPLKPNHYRDGHSGRLSHDSMIGLLPSSVISTTTGKTTKYQLFWPSLDEYSTKVKRQASIMYPKDATSAVHLLDLFPGAHVLEAGTGNGSMTLYIQRAIQGVGSHLDTVDIRGEHSLQAEKNVEGFWRGMYRSGVVFWRAEGGLQKVMRILKGERLDQIEAQEKEESAVTKGTASKVKESPSLFDIKRMKAMEHLPENPHPEGHQYDAISLDLPDPKLVLVDLIPLLKMDRPICLYMVNMSQVLELVQWMRKDCQELKMEKVLEVGWKEWSVKSAAVRSRVQGRVQVGGFGRVLPFSTSRDGNEDDNDREPNEIARDHIPDDAVGWVCRPLHLPIGHTGFLVQLRKIAVHER